jgi:flagellar basal-body rod protein FlgF
MVFSDWLVRQPNVAEPPGGRTLSYTQDRTTYRDVQAGPISHTGNALDLAIGAADGFFTVQTPQGPRLTRAGHFALSASGQITDGAGAALLDTTGKPLQVGAADAVLSITADGAISSENGRIGQIGVVAPGDAQLLRPEGNQVFAADTPTTPLAAPKLIQGAVENSNVQPTVELTRMMTVMREFQFVSQMVQSEGDRQQSAIDKITQKRS